MKSIGVNLGVFSLSFKDDLFVDYNKTFEFFKNRIKILEENDELPDIRFVKEYKKTKDIKRLYYDICMWHEKLYHISLSYLISKRMKDTVYKYGIILKENSKWYIDFKQLLLNIEYSIGRYLDFLNHSKFVKRNLEFNEEMFVIKNCLKIRFM